MTTKIETPDLLNAIAIGVGAEILKNNIKKDSKGSEEFLEVFANTHTNFKPKTWETLVDWLTYYNHAQDYERLLVPVLAKLNLPKFNIVEELAKLFANNKEKIAKGRKWSDLTDTKGAEKLLECIPFLSRPEGDKQFRKFKKFFSSYKGKLDNESLVDFLQTDDEASDLKESLTLSISKANITLVSQVKNLTDALNLNLMLRNGASKADDKINLQLRRLIISDKWELSFEESKSLFTNKEKKLGSSSFIEVPAPSAEALTAEKLEPGTRVKILDSDIDNPGEGNCAFYAFAIGLINIIQEEHLAGKKSQFEKWVKLDPGIASLFKDICDFDLTNEAAPKDKTTKDFLKQLQQSLRIINYNYQLQTIKEQCSKSSLVPSAADLAEQDKAYVKQVATLASLDAALVNREAAPIDQAKPAIVFNNKDLLDKQAFNLAILIADLAKEIADKTSPNKLQNVVKLIEYNTRLKELKEQCSRYSLITDSSKFVDLSKALSILKTNLSKKPPKRGVVAKAAVAEVIEKSGLALITEAEALAKQAVDLAKQVIAKTKENKAKAHAYRWITSSSLYIEFLGVYYFRNPKDASGNGTTALSGSSALEAAVNKLDKKTVQPEYESLVLVPLFLNLLYGEKWSSAPITKETEPKADSPIITSMARGKREYYWGTYEDLNFLGNALDVDVLHLINGRSDYERKAKEAVRHLITVNNHGNVHWTTVINYAQDLTTTDGKPVAKKPESPVSPAKKADEKSSSSPKAGGAAGALAAGATPSKTKEGDAKSDSSPGAVLGGATKKPDRAVAGAGLSAGTTAKPEGAVAGVLSAGTTKKPEGAVVGGPLSTPELGPKKDSSPAVDDATKKNGPRTKLVLLQESVNRAVLDYLKYSDSLWFSLFHRHGHTGKTRARTFLADFNNCDTYEKAQVKLITFLKDDNDNGNTYSHSLKTMLLNETMFSSEKEKPRKELADTSKNFEKILAKLIKTWGVAPQLPKPENNSWWSWK